MQFLRSQLRLCTIVDSELVTSGALLPHCRDLFDAGVTSIFLRLGGSGLPQTAREELRSLVALCKRRGRYCLSFDDTLLATSLDCDGVFFSNPPRNLSRVREVLGVNRFIGLTVTNEDDARMVKAHEENGLLDFVGVGPVLQFGDKNAHPLGLEMAHALTRRVRTLPVFWLGGIQPSELERFGEGFADGIAVVRSLPRANPAREGQRLHRLLARSLGPCMHSVGFQPDDQSFRFSALRPEELRATEIPSIRFPSL